jgi:polyphosphate kinase 2 (PPK2 family)
MDHVEDELLQPDLARWSRSAGENNYRSNGRLKRDYYEAELARLQEVLIQLQHWVQCKGLRVLIPKREEESYIRPPLIDQTFVKLLY